MPELLSPKRSKSILTFNISTDRGHIATVQCLGDSSYDLFETFETFERRFTDFIEMIPDPVIYWFACV